MSYERFHQNDQTADSSATGGNLSRQAWNQADKFDWNAHSGGDTSSQHVPNMTIHDGHGTHKENAGGTNEVASQTGQTTGSTPESTGSASTEAAANTTSAMTTGEASTVASPTTAASSVDAGLLNPAAEAASGIVNTASDATASALTPGSSQTSTLQQELASLNADEATLVQLETQVAALEKEYGITPGSESQQGTSGGATQVGDTQPTTPNQSTEGGTETTTPTPTPAMTSDATIQALQATDPQAAQLLTAMEPAQSGMSSPGFSQYESAFSQIMQGGQYADVASAATAANAQLQGSGDTADATIAANVIGSTVNATNDAAVSTYNPTNDPTVQALQASNPEAAQILTSLQPSLSGMTAAGYTQFENDLNQQVQTGGWADVASAGNAAATQLGSSGNSADAGIAQTAVTNITTQNGDATLSNYTAPPATTTTDTPPATTTTDTPPATTTTDTPPATTTTDTPPATTTTDTPPAATTTTTTTTTTPTGGSTTQTGTGTTANTSGLYVQGNQLMDNGKPFVMLGVNDTTSTEHNELTGSMAQIASEGANTVRIMGQASDLEGGPNNAFNQEIQTALNAGLKVDLSYNTDTAIYGDTGGVMSSADVAEGQQALYAAAAEWGNNPNVMYNVVNEQGASGDATNPQLLSNTVALEQSVVQGAQSVNPNAKPVIIVDDSEWGQGGYDSNYQGQSFLYNNAAALEAAGNNEVVGAVHNYQSGNSYTNQGIEAIQNEGMPVTAEEIGYNTSSFNLSEQVLPTTGEPVGGMVWVDGNDPQTGSFYNNVLTDPNTAPQVQNFWQTVNSEVASATPTSSS